MVDTRSGFWLQLSVLALTVLVVVITLLAGHEDEFTFRHILANALVPAGILLPVVGILLVSSEWSQRTALVSFALVPERARLIAAKVLGRGRPRLCSRTAFAAVVAALGTLVASADIAHVWTFPIGLVGQYLIYVVTAMVIGVGLRRRPASLGPGDRPLLRAARRDRCPRLDPRDLRHRRMVLQRLLRMAGPERAERPRMGPGPGGAGALDGAAPGDRHLAGHPARPELRPRVPAVAQSPSAVPYPRIRGIRNSGRRARASRRRPWQAVAASETPGTDLFGGSCAGTAASGDRVPVGRDVAKRAPSGRRASRRLLERHGERVPSWGAPLPARRRLVRSLAPYEEQAIERREAPLRGRAVSPHAEVTFPSSPSRPGRSRLLPARPGDVRGASSRSPVDPRAPPRSPTERHG